MGFAAGEAELGVSTRMLESSKVEAWRLALLSLSITRGPSRANLG